jgi:hypothetical protein
MVVFSQNHHFRIVSYTKTKQPIDILLSFTKLDGSRTRISMQLFSMFNLEKKKKKKKTQFVFQKKVFNFYSNTAYIMQNRNICIYIYIYIYIHLFKIINFPKFVQRQRYLTHFYKTIQLSSLYLNKFDSSNQNETIRHTKTLIARSI